MQGIHLNRIYYNEVKFMFKKYELVGFFFTSILGCLLHFVYEWTGENIIAAIFSATDESTFQHLKLFFFPLPALDFC